jgi:hypothetical protein
MQPCILDLAGYAGDGPATQAILDGTLRATGGALRDDKSYRYLVDFKYCQGRWKYLSIQEAPGELDLKVVDSKGRPLPHRETLTCIEPSDARETLGVYIAMDGNWRAQKVILIAKATQFAKYLQTTKPDRDTTWYAFHVAFLKSLAYPMEATCLSLSDWDDIISPLLGITMQLCRIPSTFPRDLIFTLLQYQGLGVQHPFYSQMMKHLVTRVTETANARSATGDLLKGAVEDLRREVGLPGEFTAAPWGWLGTAVAHMWLTHFMCFAHSHKDQIHDPLPKLLSARPGDRCLMELFLSLPFTSEELAKLIAWRQFYDVIWVSDIVSSSGHGLLQHIWKGDTFNRWGDNPLSPRRPPRRGLDLAL